MNLFRFIVGIIVILMVTVGVTAIIWALAQGIAYLWTVNDGNITLTPCATEDSDNCYWDADTMGNGEGRSFVVIDGTVYYSK